MKVTTKSLPKSRQELTIEIPKSELEKSRKAVIDQASQNANIKGFRKGAKIPEDVIVRQFGDDVIYQMSIEKAIEKTYQDALRKEKLIPITPAEIKNVDTNSDPVTVTLEVETFPDVKMKKGYRDIKLKKKPVKVQKKEVDDALEDIKKRFTHYHDASADYAAQMGDKVTLDTDGFDEAGTPLESTSMRAYPIILGSNVLVPGFEDDIVGMKPGEEKDIDVNFPKDYHNPDFAGKKTKFHVKVDSIETPHEPEFTPEFIEQLRGKKLDLDGFRELIEQELTEVKQSNAQVEQEVQLIDELLKYADMDLGDGILAQQIEQTYNEIKENVAKDGLKMEDYLASLGLTEEDYKNQHVADSAKKRLQGELIFNELANAENIEVSDEQMQEEIDKIMSRFESEDVLKRLGELYVPGNRYYEELKRRAGYRQLIDSFFE